MELKEFVISNSKGQKLLADIRWKPSKTKQPLVVFCHGFKGFKDWGAWNKMADYFADAGLICCKFNFSGNGIGLEDKYKFTNLEAFAQNTISQELDDMHSLFSHLREWKLLEPIVDFSNLFLLGHSRAAATCLIECTMNPNVKKLVTWAGMFNLFSWVQKHDLESWKEDGAIAFTNARTGQEMKVNYSFVEDLNNNKTVYDLENCLDKLEIPLLMLHGSSDEAVSSEASEYVYSRVMHSIYIPVEKSGHTFDTKHPFTEQSLPESFESVIENTVEFLLD